jgi:hypothetical protein
LGAYSIYSQVKETAIINDTLHWIKIQGSSIANGSEKYITIGQFSDAAGTLKIRRNSGARSHYEVNDVNVIATGSQMQDRINMLILATQYP